MKRISYIGLVGVSLLLGCAQNQDEAPRKSKSSAKNSSNSSFDNEESFSSNVERSSGGADISSTPPGDDFDDDNDLAEECENRPTETYEYEGRLDQSFKIPGVNAEISARGTILASAKATPGGFSVATQEDGDIEVSPTFAEPIARKEITKSLGGTYHYTPSIKDFSKKQSKIKCLLAFSKKMVVTNKVSSFEVTFSRPIPFSVIPDSKSISKLNKLAPKGYVEKGVTVTFVEVSGELASKYSVGQKIRGDFSLQPEGKGTYAFLPDMGGAELDIFGTNKNTATVSKGLIVKMGVVRYMKEFDITVDLEFDLVR